MSKQTTLEETKRIGKYTELPLNKGDNGKFKGHQLLEVTCEQLTQFHYINERSEGEKWAYGTVSEVGKDNLTRAGVAKSITFGTAPVPLFRLYRDKRRALQPAIEKFNARAKSTKRKRKYGIEGAELDIDRVMVGNPECWGFRKRGARRAHVKLACQFVYGAYASQDVYANTAAFAAAAADALTLKGYAVSIDALYICRAIQSEVEVTIRVPLKSVDAPLDHRKILTIGLPSMSRVFAFGAAMAMHCDPCDSEVVTGSQALREHLKFSAYIGGKLDLSTLNAGTGNIKTDPAIEGFFHEARAVLS